MLLCGSDTDAATTAATRRSCSQRKRLMPLLSGAESSVLGSAPAAASSRNVAIGSDAAAGGAAFAPF